MAIAGTEWLLLGAIAFLLITFRPNSIIALARSTGKAVNEFKTGDNEALRQDRELADIASIFYIPIPFLLSPASGSQAATARKAGLKGGLRRHTQLR